MILLIDHKPAAIKDGSSFDYTSDNRLFNDRDDYTMSIELPLDNPENAAIFGNIHRKDADIDNIYFDAEIIADNFHKSGAVVIVSITESLAKVQFISGRSFQNFYPAFDNTYIDELDLGAIPYWIPDNYADTHGGGNNRNTRPSTRPGGAGSRPGGSGGSGGQEESITKTTSEAWGTGDIIALPWVNAASGNIQNRADYLSNQWIWHVRQDDDDDTEIVRRLSCQIRLYTLVEKICTALGYTFEGQDWQSSDWYCLYSFNSVPGAWGARCWEDTLPHWSVNELFNNIESLMLCEFDINHKDKRISFSWSNENVANAGTLAIDRVVDEFQASVSKEDDSQYRGKRNVGYADAGHNMSNIYCCDWYFRKSKVYMKEYDTLQEIITFLNNQPASWFRGEAWSFIFHALDVDNYFIMYVTGRYLTDPAQVDAVNQYSDSYKLLPLNAFGARIFDEENWDDQEDIEIVPAWIDETDRGWLPFFDAGELDNEATSGEQYKHVIHGWTSEFDHGTVEPDQILQSTRYRSIKDGDKDDQSSYSTLQVGFWYGASMYYYGAGQLPHPFLDEYDTITDVNYFGNPYNALFQTYYVQQSWRYGSLRLNSNKYGQGKTLAQTIDIDNRKKYEFSFLMDGMPDVRATYIIRGKKYLCSSIKAEITQNGLSRLKKGTFWRILD